MPYISMFDMGVNRVMIVPAGYVICQHGVEIGQMVFTPNTVDEIHEKIANGELSVKEVQQDDNSV